MFYIVKLNRIQSVDAAHQYELEVHEARVIFCLTRYQTEWLSWMEAEAMFGLRGSALREIASSFLS